MKDITNICQNLRLSPQHIIYHPRAINQMNLVSEHTGQTVASKLFEIKNKRVMVHPILADMFLQNLMDIYMKAYKKYN